MSSHVSQSEFRRYFNIITSKAPIGDDIDFINEIDAHVSECSECFEKMQTARLLMHRLLSDKEAADRFIGAWYPETTAQPVFDIRKAFPGVKVIITEKLQALADTLSDKMNAVFVRDEMSPAMVRGGSETVDVEPINDLVHSSMEFELKNGRKIMLRCRNVNNSGDITLFVYSNFEVDFMVTSQAGEIPLYKKEYDDLIGEYVYLYKLDRGSFNLTVR